ncbi:hypothetical protein [Saccharopolyspora phatthalungensis]|uniref:Chromosome segregation ATPase n=1 Tax=Saccharopolyspora phatthalungensis TaxID=664693 RepID=A0A840Q034_9PSEU|nr:hypothetical protein [Saccharopolyspora phatthalungensis]MBB5152861.1 chromosome segregation ATPase [Saccharopolyspora phatthalungensis]
MTDDPRAALLAAANSGDDAQSALRALRHALAWSACAVGSAQRIEVTDPAAIELVIALDDAFAEVDGLLEQVPGLAEAAVAGVEVTEYLNRQAGTLTNLADLITVARREHEALASVEAELRESGEEHTRILGEIDELRRLERLRDALPALREQHESLNRRLEAMVSPVAEAERALYETADKVVLLSAERLADLDERIQQVLAKLQRSEADWAEQDRLRADAETKLRQKNAEYEKLRTEREGVLAALRQHAEIDGDLLDRIAAARDGTALDRVRSVVTDIKASLDQVDAALRDALDRYVRFVEENRKVLPWRDEP